MKMICIENTVMFCGKKEYENAASKEKRREENSKSARIARKLEQMRLTDELVTKIKLRNVK